MANTIIELKNLSIGYGNKKVLQDVNAKINKGEIVGIIGCNSCIYIGSVDKSHVV